MILRPGTANSEYMKYMNFHISIVTANSVANLGWPGNKIKNKQKILL